MKWIVQYVQPEDISGQRRLQVLNSEIVVATGFLQRSIVSMIEMNLSKLLWVIESSCAVTTSLKNEAEERAIKAETLLYKYQNENTSLIKGRENADAEILEGCAKLLNSKKVEILKLQEDVKILSEALSTSKRECKEERTAKELSLARQLILETELAATDEGSDEDSRAMQDDAKIGGPADIPPFDSEDEERILNGKDRRRGDGQDEDDHMNNSEHLQNDLHHSFQGIIDHKEEDNEQEREQGPSRKRPAPSLD